MGWGDFPKKMGIGACQHVIRRAFGKRSGEGIRVQGEGGLVMGNGGGGGFVSFSHI